MIAVLTRVEVLAGEGDLRLRVLFPLGGEKVKASISSVSMGVIIVVVVLDADLPCRCSTGDFNGSLNSNEEDSEVV